MACMKLNFVIFTRSGRLNIIHLLALAFLLSPTLSPTHFTAQCRQFSQSSGAAMRMNQEKTAKMRLVIGSKPPRCDQRCKLCGQCQAVQVPIAPTKKFLIQKHRNSQFYATPRTAYSTGDDISNYKPMCWKCKCGDFIFNPW